MSAQVKAHVSARLDPEWVADLVEHARQGPPAYRELVDYLLDAHRGAGGNDAAAQCRAVVVWLVRVLVDEPEDEPFSVSLP